MVGESIEELSESVLELFEAYYREEVLFDVDRALASEMRLETRPAVEALAMALILAAPADDKTLGHHESLAMVTLLGRRAAVLGATPSGAERIVRAMRRSFRSVGHPIPEAAIDALSLANLEGYSRGRDELQAAKLERESAESIVSVRIAPRVLAFRPFGLFETETLESKVDDFARQLHREDAACALIDLSGLLGPGRRRAAVILGVDESARMLGAHCIFGGLSDAWTQAFAEAGADPKLVHTFPSYSDALFAALETVGLRVGATPGERLRRLLRRER